MQLCSLPVIYLGPNYGGGTEDNGDLLQKVPRTHCYTQCPQPCSRPLLTYTSARDCWTFMGKSGSIFRGVTAPFSWVLMSTRFVCALQESVSPVLRKFWWLYGGGNGNFLQEGLCHTQVCCTQNPAPVQNRAGLYLHRRHSNTALSQSLWGLWVLVQTRFV